MIAAMDAELASDIRIISLLYVLHMSPVDSYWHIVFGLASDSTGMASYAFTIVYHEAVVDHTPPSMRADRPSWQMSLRHTHNRRLAMPAAATQVPTTEPMLPAKVTISTFPTRFFQNRDRSSKCRNA